MRILGHPAVTPHPAVTSHRYIGDRPIRTLQLVDQSTSHSYVGPYAIAPGGDQTILNLVDLPPEVRLAWEVLQAAHRAVGRVLRDHFQADEILLQDHRAPPWRP